MESQKLVRDSNVGARISRSRSSRDLNPDSSTSSSESSTEEDEDGRCSNANRVYSDSKAKDLWRKVRKHYTLVDFPALPDYLRDNEYIRGHYRADWPLKEALLSIFRIHNETLNIWTHLIGFFLFLGLTIYTAWQMPRVEYPSLAKFSTFPMFTDLNKLHSEIMACFPPLPPFVPSLFGGCSPPACEGPGVMLSSGNHQCIVRIISEDLSKLMSPLMRKPATRWPFFIFLGGAMFCLLTSSTCHLLCCHSSRLSYVLWRLDYAGIAAMIATSFFPPVYYTFLCNPRWRNFYLTGITIIGLLTVSVSLTPLLQKPKYRPLRALLFFSMGVSGVIPGVHKLISHRHEPVTVATTAYEILMGLFYALGALFYATRIPERWRPGRFDIAGHSHQIFHILVVAGAYTHYKAALLYIEWRDSHGCD